MGHIRYIAVRPHSLLKQYKANTHEQIAADRVVKTSHVQRNGLHPLLHLHQLLDGGGLLTQPAVDALVLLHHLGTIRMWVRIQVA